MLGQTLGGKYTIERLLGEGGMGAVYEARHTGTGRRVAIKVITGDLGKNPMLASRFEVEAKAAGTIESEHVVAVLDVGRDEARGTPFMVMEHLTGEDVSDLLARTGPLAPDAAVRIAVQALQGLEKAHASGVIHRDIKPANIFLNKGDGGTLIVKVLDFGVAKIADEKGRAKLTRTGAIIGSPLYMSPEQARSGKMDHRTDLWSMGIVLYEMLAGVTPLHDLDAIGELILAICSRPPPPLLAQAPWVDPALAAVVMKALSIDPAQRHQSARELEGALTPFLHGGSSELRASMLVSARAAAQGPSGTAVTPLPVNEAQFAATTPSQEVMPPPVGGKTEIGAPPHISLPTGGPAWQTTGPAVVPVPVKAEPPRAAGSNKIALILIGLLVAGGAAAGIAALVFKKPGPQAGDSGRPVHTASTAKPPATAPTGPAHTAETPPSAGPFAALAGVWKSNTGRVYDAVPRGEGMEFQIRDASQFPGQGYENGEARFVLTAIPTQTHMFNVEDRERPPAPDKTPYDAAKARPTCLITWTEVAGKNLRAHLEGEKLTVKLAQVLAKVDNFTIEKGRVVRCARLGTARITEVESILEKQ